VVRIGDTVRRPVGPHSPLVHALLAHLESVGFEGAPRFLGIDSLYGVMSAERAGLARFAASFSLAAGMTGVHAGSGSVRLGLVSG